MIGSIKCLHWVRHVKMSRALKHLVMFDWNLDAMLTNAKNRYDRDDFVQMGLIIVGYDPIDAILMS